MSFNVSFDFENIPDKLTYPQRGKRYELPVINVNRINGVYKSTYSLFIKRQQAKDLKRDKNRILCECCGYTISVYRINQHVKTIIHRLYQQKELMQ